MSNRKRRGRGEGSIEELPSGKFRVVVSAGIDSVTGKRIKITRSFDTKGEALKFRDEMLRLQRDGSLSIRPANLSVGQWLDEWLAQKKAKVEPATYLWYERRARLHIKPTIGSLPVARLTVREIEGMHAALTERGASASEQFKAATTLRAALADAVRQDVIGRNPALRLKKPKVQRREMRPLDRDEAGVLLAVACADRLRCLYDVGLDTGARPGELFALHWPDIDWAACELFIHQSLEEIDGHHRLKPPKTSAGRRRVRVARRTLASLREHRERMRAEGLDVETGLVFADIKGGFLRLSNFHRDSFRPVLRRAGLAGKGIRPYDLRHTSATLLLMMGVNVKVVSQRLGHESIEITLKHYTHCLPTMQEAAADAVDRLFGDCPTVVPQTAIALSGVQREVRAG